jgi:hypothetical protein
MPQRCAFVDGGSLQAYCGWTLRDRLEPLAFDGRLETAIDLPVLLDMSASGSLRAKKQSSNPMARKQKPRSSVGDGGVSLFGDAP